MENNLSWRDKERLARKEEIVRAAEKLFLENGFENTSVVDIAREATFTIRTIYRYFVSKEDLLFAIAIREIEKLNQYLNAALEEGKSAFEKIQLSNRAYYRFYKEHPGIFGLINFRPSNKLYRKESPNYVQLLKLQSASFEKYTGIIEQGKLDGSIRPDIDPKKAAHFGIISGINFLNAMSNASKEYWENYKLEEGDFILFGFDLLCDSLRPVK